MYKILLAAGVVVMLVLFGLQNSDHTAVSFIFGAPTKVRLIFLLLMAGGLGFLIAYLRGLSREIKFRREIRRLSGSNGLGRREILVVEDEE